MKAEVTVVLYDSDGASIWSSSRVEELPETDDGEQAVMTALGKLKGWIEDARVSIIAQGEATIRVLQARMKEAEAERESARRSAGGHR
jgi:hypothetical protein